MSRGPCQTGAVRFRHRSEIKWGAVIALLGLFIMHGATASAAPAHCGGESAVGHVHSVAAIVHDPRAGMSATNLQMSSVGVPLPAQDGGAGGFCVAVLVVGFLALLTRGALISLGAGTSSRPICASAPPLQRAPPAPTRSELSIWRN